MNTPHVDQQFLLCFFSSSSGYIPLFQWILVENILENCTQIYALRRHLKTKLPESTDNSYLKHDFQHE